MYRIKKISKLVLAGIAIIATAIAATNGYSDIRNMNEVQGISVDSTMSQDFKYQTIASPDPATPAKVAIVSNNVAQPTTHHTTSKKMRPVVKTKIVSSGKVHIPGIPGSPTLPPPIPTPSTPTPPEVCFVAAEEGIYVPRGGNTASITVTADHPVYWRTMSAAITKSDDGLDVPADFPAYIVLESDYDPNVATNSISFHLHSRSTAPLGEYCPKTEKQQIGLEAYLQPGKDAKKTFDIPMNINVVEKLGN